MWKIKKTFDVIIKKLNLKSAAIGPKFIVQILGLESSSWRSWGGGACFFSTLSWRRGCRMREWHDGPQLVGHLCRPGRHQKSPQFFKCLYDVAILSWKSIYLRHNFSVEVKFVYGLFALDGMFSWILASGRGSTQSFLSPIY